MSDASATALATAWGPPVLEADCVVKRYGDRLVLKAGSVRAVPGVVVGLLGRNGSGKSTLLRIMTGGIAPDSGVVRVDGEGRLAVSLPWLAARGVFFLPDRDLLHPRVDVGTQLAWVGDRFSHRDAVSRVCATMGITATLSSKPRQLSSGERRRAEVACALIRAPRVLVLDEPLRGVAPLDAEVILSALREFARAGGAVVLTGHELPLLLPALDRVTWCTAGTTREFATVPSAMEDFAFRRDFLPLR